MPQPANPAYFSTTGKIGQTDTAAALPIGVLGDYITGMVNAVPRLPAKQSWHCALSENAWVTLAAYRGEERHELHRHDCSQLTFQLAGALNERLEGRDYQANGAMVGFKPAGALHADEWGRAGSLLFTINAKDEAANFLFEGQFPGWRRIACRAEIVRLVASLSGANATMIEEALPDLVALCTFEDVCSATGEEGPPSWLARIREALCDDPEGNSISILSARESVHRVHLARSFRRHFGVTPSQFRRNQMAARLAVSLANEDLSLAECALAGGFCDQSHASRVFLLETGLRLSQWRAMLGRRQVSFVQDLRLASS